MVIPGCGDDPVCTPGAQVECACPAGAKGAQSCNADGSGYDTCDCSSGPTSTGGPTGSGGGPASSSASTGGEGPASTAASTGTGGGSSSCDNKGVCEDSDSDDTNDCVGCVITVSHACDRPLNACVGDANCVDYLMCVNACTKPPMPACVDACKVQTPGGEGAFAPVATCFCNSCANDCAGAFYCN